MQAEKFLRALWPDEPSSGHLVIFKLDRIKNIKMSAWCKTVDECIAIVDRDRDSFELYIGAASQNKEEATKDNPFGRGNSAAAMLLPGVFVDIDINDGGHKSENLAPDFASALSLANATGLPPSIIVRTGHGLQAWWLFDEPRPAHEVGGLLASFVGTMQVHGEVKKWDVDSVGDLARLMRLPGGVNRKLDPVDVTAEVNDLRYTPSDLEAVCTVLLKPATTVEPGEVTPEALEILRMCVPLLAPGRADTYAEWVRIGLALKAAGGAAALDLWHDFSRMSGKYDAGEVDKAWGTFKPNRVGLGTLIHAAREDSKTAVLTLGGSAWDHVEPALAASEGNGPARPPTSSAVSTVAPGRARVSNVIDDVITTQDGKEVEVTYYRPLPDIAQMLSDATGNWPRRAGSILFSVNGAGDVSRPDHRPVQFLTQVDQFFAWLMGPCDVRWHGGHCRHVGTEDKMIVPTKKEFFEYVKSNPAATYAGVELLPHFPEVSDVYYIQTPLPPPPEEGTVTPLTELIERLNPETELDRQLILAAMLTPAWGGACGARPAFVFTSDHGRGVGKTKTATAIARVYGGNVSVSGNEDWDTVRKRLLGDESMTKRIVLIDNLKGRLNSGDIEGAITSAEIDGWKPYHGQASRPNRITWFITANSPSLSRDLADRSIIIKIGKQKHGFDFDGWANDHIDKHRGVILAELFAILKRPVLSPIAKGNRDRWQAWQNAILARLDDGDELAELAMKRRPDVDADLSDADEIAGAFIQLFEDRMHHDYEAQRIFIPNSVCFEWMQRAGVVDKNLGRRGCATWLRNCVGSGPLADFRPYKGDNARGFLYTGPMADTKSRLIVLEDRSFAGSN